MELNQLLFTVCHANSCSVSPCQGRPLTSVGVLHWNWKNFFSDFRARKTRAYVGKFITVRLVALRRKDLGAGRMMVYLMEQGDKLQPLVIRLHSVWIHSLIHRSVAAPLIILQSVNFSTNSINQPQMPKTHDDYLAANSNVFCFFFISF